MLLADYLTSINGPQRDGLTALYRTGVVTLVTLTAYEIYQVYQTAAQMPCFADQPRRLARYVAEQAGVHPKTVYRALAHMSQQV